MGFGGNDPDLLYLLLGPLYLFTGILLIAVSLLNYKRWMESSKTAWMRTVLLAGPGTVLSVLIPIALGPHLWDVPPYGFDLVAASWVLGIGIFIAGSRFVIPIQPDAHQEAVSGNAL